MLVSDVMTASVVSVPPETTLKEADRILRDRGIRHLPVVKDGRLIGVVSDRDLRLATSCLLGSPLGPGAPVSKVMSEDPATADVSDAIEDAAFRMRTRKIGCLPVIKDDQLVGIITGMDLLDAILNMTGVDKPSGRLEVRLPDHPGELSRLTAFLSHRDLNVHSVLTYPEGPKSRRAVLRVGSIETRTIAHDLRADQFEVLWPPEKPCPR